jgi:PadR family transcriptional regulator PadR
MISVATAKVLAAFLEAPQREQYGFGLMRATGLKSGSLYPILDRLNQSGWLRAYDEDIDEVAAGRPKRRLYSLSALGEEEAPRAVAEFYHDLGPALRWRPRLEGA